MDLGINGWLAVGAAGVAAWYIFCYSAKPKAKTNLKMPSANNILAETHRTGSRGVQDMLAYNSMSQANNALLSLTPQGTTESRSQSYATTDYYNHQDNSGYLMRL